MSTRETSVETSTEKTRASVIYILHISPLVGHRISLCRLHLTGELHSLINSERALAWNSGDFY